MRTYFVSSIYDMGRADCSRREELLGGWVWKMEMAKVNGVDIRIALVYRICFLIQIFFEIYMTM